MAPNPFKLASNSMQNGSLKSEYPSMGASSRERKESSEPGVPGVPRCLDSLSESSPHCVLC